MARRDILRYDERAQRQLGMKDSTRRRMVDSNAMRQVLLLFQQSMLPLLDHIDEIPSLTNRWTQTPSSWLASWVDFHLDASLPIHQQRELFVGQYVCNVLRYRGWCGKYDSDFDGCTGDDY